MESSLNVLIFSDTSDHLPMFHLASYFQTLIKFPKKKIRTTKRTVNNNIVLFLVSGKKYFLGKYLPNK